MESQDDNKPALDAPPGQQSQFDGRNGSLQPTIIATLVACLFLSTASAIVRFYAQRAIFCRYIWADGMSPLAIISVFNCSPVLAWILLGWASHVAFAAMLLISLPYGAGYHQWDVRLSAFHKIGFVRYCLHR